MWPVGGKFKGGKGVAGIGQETKGIFFVLSMVIGEKHA